MEENKKIYNESTNEGHLTQYGKKGHKPRRGPITREKIDLDAIQTNNIIYWNQSAGYENVTKFLWDLIIGYPKDIASAIDDSYFMSNGGIVLNDSEMNPAAIMTIDCYMGPGWAESTNDGVNRGLAQVMASIRASLSTSNIGFETADLGIYLSSTSSIAYTIGLAKRILESRRVWKDRNMVYPRALCRAMNVDWTDITSNINTYASRLNTIIDRYNNMKIPDVAWCYDRQYAMMHNIFCDEPSDYGQLYIFRPLNYYIYDDTLGIAKAKEFPWYLNNDELISFNTILDIIEDMLDAWYNSSDLYQINGTLLRAFKDAPVQSMPDFDMEANIEPVQDRAHLMQIMNCNIVSDMDFSSLDIYQDPATQNYVIWKPHSLGAKNYVSRKEAHVLRLFEDDISNEDNMELTRLLNLYSAEPHPTETGKYYTQYRNCGSEIVGRIGVASYNSMTDSVDMIYYSSNELIIDTTSSAGLLVTMKRIAYMSPFRYIPCFHLIYTDGITANHGGILGDLYNWKVYDIKDWNVLQFNAYLSLWKPRI